MRSTRLIQLSILVLTLAQSPVHAGDESQHAPARLGEHPAVLVARHGIRPDPTAKFYLHPARLEWSLQRPLSEGEHPAVLVARRAQAAATIDPNTFILAHPARGTSTSSAAAASAIR